MGRRRHTPEEIIGKLREAEVLIAQGRSVAEAARAIGVTGSVALAGYGRAAGLFHGFCCSVGGSAVRG